MIRNSLQDMLLSGKRKMQNYVDGKREGMICLYVCLHIYKMCKIPLRGYKRKHRSLVASEEGNCARGKGMELESFPYLLVRTI